MESLTPTKDERMWGMISHLSALVAFIIPLGSVLGPLVVWLVKREDSPFIDQNGKEALNFAISILIYMTVSGILMLVLIGILLVILVALFWLIFVIIAAIRANEGTVYRYPLTIRFIK